MLSRLSGVSDMHLCHDNRHSGSEFTTPRGTYTYPCICHAHDRPFDLYRPERTFRPIGTWLEDDLGGGVGPSPFILV